MKLSILFVIPALLLGACASKNPPKADFSPLRGNLGVIGARLDRSEELARQIEAKANQLP